jgi:hypothetical protein
MGLATETTSDSCFPGSACMDAEAMVSTSVASNSDVEFSTNHFDTLCGFFRVRVQPGIHFDDFATQFCKKKVKIHVCLKSIHTMHVIFALKPRWQPTLAIPSTAKPRAMLMSSEQKIVSSWKQ